MFKTHTKTEIEQKLLHAKHREAPRPPRYASLALVRINGFEGYAVLRNVSAGGFRMESKTFVDMEAGNACSIQITPETEAGISQFDFEVSVQWVQSFAEKFAAGFRVVHGNIRPLEEYVAFLQRKGA
jgi:hypothetical protein